MLAVGVTLPPARTKQWWYFFMVWSKSFLTRLAFLAAKAARAAGRRILLSPPEAAFYRYQLAYLR